MPKYVGMVVSIVGGLVLGETAVNAGIISAPTQYLRIKFKGGKNNGENQDYDNC